MKKRGPLLEKIFKTRKAAEAAARAAKRKRPGALVRCWPRSKRGGVFEYPDYDGDSPADWCVEVWDLADYILHRFDPAATPEEIARVVDGWQDDLFILAYRKRSARHNALKNKKREERERKAEQIAAFNRLREAFPKYSKKWIQDRIAQDFAKKHPRTRGWGIKTVTKNTAGCA